MSIDTLNEGKTYILKDIRLKVASPVRYFNTSLNEQFSATETEKFESLAQIKEMNAEDIVEAKITGVFVVNKYLLCFECNRRVKEKNNILHCDSCNMSLRSTDAITSWFVKARLKDVHSRESYTLSFHNNVLAGLFKQCDGFDANTSEDVVAKNIPDLEEEIFQISYDIIERTVTSIQ